LPMKPAGLGVEKGDNTLFSPVWQALHSA
jgi:hypothetical protein